MSCLTDICDFSLKRPPKLYCQESNTPTNKKKNKILESTRAEKKLPAAKCSANCGEVIMVRFLYIDQSENLINSVNYWTKPQDIHCF